MQTPTDELHLLSALRKQFRNVLFITGFHPHARPPECFPEGSQPCKFRPKPRLAGAAPRLIGAAQPAPRPGRAEPHVGSAGRAGPPTPGRAASAPPGHRVPPNTQLALQTAKPQRFATNPLFLATSQLWRCAFFMQPQSRPEHRGIRADAAAKLQSCESIQLPSSAFRPWPGTAQQ